MNDEKRIFIKGSGAAGLAVARAWATLSVMYPDEKLACPEFLKREDPWPEDQASGDSYLALANPHGLHARALHELSQKHYKAIFVEKPAAVTLDQVDVLSATTAKVLVFHGYRTLWGPATIRQWIRDKKLGQVFSIEIRYWQGSAAARSLDPTKPGKSGWKNNPALSGPHDVLLDLGTHVLDLACFVAGEDVTALKKRLLYPFAEAPHRDTHVQLVGQLGGSVAFLASTSKAFHGATNQLSVSVLGEKASLTWDFMRPDEISIGTGRNIEICRRADTELGLRLAPFHGAGWMEGYAQVLREGLGLSTAGLACDLRTHLQSVQWLLKAADV